MNRQTKIHTDILSGLLLVLLGLPVMFGGTNVLLFITLFSSLLIGLLVALMLALLSRPRHH